MKIPKKIQIAGKTYDIVFNNEKLKNDNCIGAINYEESRIYLQDFKSDISRRQQTEVTLVHEILHGCITSTGKRIHDEKLVTALSELLYQVIKQLKD